MSDRYGDVAGRRVVLTGAGRGLGRILASAFGSAGAQLGLVSRSTQSLESLAAELGSDPLVCPGDVRDAEFNASVAKAMVERYGGVDVWIANAGVSPQVSPVVQMEPSTWREIVDVNLTGAFLGARAAAAVMGEGGRIIVTGSVLGRRPRAGLSAYAASKAGLESLVQALAQELGPRSITVNAVALGWFDTGLGAHWHRDAELENDIARHTALGRWGGPADLAGAFVFLASAASAYVTGTTITVDGGYSLM